MKYSDNEKPLESTATRLCLRILCGETYLHRMRASSGGAPVTSVDTRSTIRLANVEDVDTTMWTFDIIHVKGEGTYGLPRTVPLHPDVREILSLYLILRKKWLVDNNLNSHALFPSKNGADGYLSGNAIRNIKATVEDDLDVKFDLRTCRRTFGQRYLDSDVDIESVSVLMGHASTKTTEGFYSRKRLNKTAQLKQELVHTDVAKHSPNRTSDNDN